MREAVKDKEGKVEKKGEFTTFYHAHHNEVARLLGVDRVPDPPLHSTFAFNCYSGLMVGQSGDHRIIFGEKWFNYDLFISDLCRGVKQFSAAYGTLFTCRTPFAFFFITRVSFSEFVVTPVNKVRASTLSGSKRLTFLKLDPKDYKASKALVARNASLFPSIFLWHHILNW